MSALSFDPQLEDSLYQMEQAGRVARALRENGEVEMRSVKLAQKLFGKVNGLTIKLLFDGEVQTARVYSTYQS